MDSNRKEYNIPASWDFVVTFGLFAVALTCMAIWEVYSEKYTLGAYIFLICIVILGCFVAGTSFHLTEMGLTRRVLGIPVQTITWEQAHLIRFIHPRSPRESPFGMHSSCLILYRDFPHYPQKYKTDWDGFLFLLFLLCHPRSAYCIHVPYNRIDEFLVAIKDLSRLPVEEILPGVEATESQNIQPPPVSGESGLREPRKEKNMEKQPKQHKLLICFLFGFTALNGLCFGLSPTQTDTTIRLTLIGAAVVMLLGVVLYPLMLPRQVDDCGLAIRGFLVFAGFSAVYLYLAFSWWLLAIVAVELVVLVPLTIQLLRKNK